MSDRDAAKAALTHSVNVGKISGIRAGAEVLRALAKIGADLRPGDLTKAAKKLDAMAEQIDQTLPPEIRRGATKP